MSGPWPEGPVTLRSPSSLALVAAHLVPMFGVQFLGWNIGDVLLIAWGDVAVLGVFTLLKVAAVDRRWFLLRGPFALIAIAFLLAALLGIILALEHEVRMLETGQYASADYTAMAWALAPAVAAFVVSHGTSFVLDFLRRREFEHVSSEAVAKQFFQRALPLLAIAMLTGFVLSAFGNVTLLLLAVIAIRLAADLGMHLLEHRT